MTATSFRWGNAQFLMKKHYTLSGCGWRRLLKVADTCAAFISSIILKQRWLRNPQIVHLERSNPSMRVTQLLNRCYASVQEQERREQKTLKIFELNLIWMRTAAERFRERETALLSEPELVIRQLPGWTLANFLGASGSCRMSNSG